MINPADDPLPAENGDNVTAPAGAPESPRPEGDENLPAALAAAQAEIADLKDKFLRAKAESDNIRRRADADVSAARKYAVESFAAEVLAVRDSLDLARTVEIDSGNREAVQKMHEGLELTLKVLDGVFQKFGLALVDPQGEKFDPERHQAISMVESDQVPANHVVNVVQKGYMLRDRLLRPAMVVVARAKAG